MAAHWTRRTLRSVTLFRRGLRSKARDFNWHNVIGFWSCGAARDRRRVRRRDLVPVGDQPRVSRRRRVAARRAAAGCALRPGGCPLELTGLDALVARAEQRTPDWRSITLTLPTKPDAPATFAIDGGTGGQPQKRAELQLDRASGNEVRWQPFSAGTPGRRLRSILRFAHTGEVLGVVGQTIAGIVTLGAVFLVYTGLALTLRRFLKWTRRRRRFGTDGATRRAAVRA